METRAEYKTTVTIEQKRFTLRLPEPLHQRLVKCAKQQDRSLNKMACIAFGFYLDNWEYYNK